MYTYTVVLDNAFEPSNQEQRTQVAEYVAIYNSKDRFGWDITSLDYSGVMSAWNARYNRIDFSNTKIISILDKSGKILFQQSA